MKKNPERLAWTIMLSSFFLCCGLTIGLPYSAWWFVNNATVIPEAIVAAGQGTLLVTQTPGSPPIAVTTSQSMTMTDEDYMISTLESNGQGTLDVMGPGRQSIVTLRIYEGTQITLTRLASPRFTWSPNAHEVGFKIGHGGVRVYVPPEQARSVDVRVSTPLGDAVLEGEGAFLIEVEDGAAQVSVTRNIVVINCRQDRIIVGPDQDAKLNQEGCSRVEGDQRGRNLVRGGDFREPLQPVWQLASQTKAGFPAGIIEEVTSEGQPAVRFLRSAADWGMTGIDQTLDANIRDKPTVILHLWVRIDSQNLDVCGVEGTECPIMVRIEFEDRDGNRKTWMEGFYAQDDPAISTPMGCAPSCREIYPPQWRYVAPHQWEPYESPNLIEELSKAGFTPRTITSISISASGHSYAALVRDVQLLVQD